MISRSALAMVFAVCGMSIGSSAQAAELLIDRSITKKEVLEAQRAWCTALVDISKAYLITHELQPALAGDTAVEGFVPRPTRGAGSWRRDRISG